MQVVERSGWGAKEPRRGRATIQQNRIRGVCFHVIGNKAKIVDGDARMRQVQNYHMRNRGAYDILYNFSGDTVDYRIFKGRGFSHMSAAEGKKSQNREWVSFLIQCSTKHSVDDATRDMMIRFVVGVTNWMRDTHNPLFVPEIVGHRFVKPKECPGNKVIKVISDSSFKEECLQLADLNHTANPPPQNEYADAIHLGITDGSRPDDSATRYEAAVMALRASRL